MSTVTLSQRELKRRRKLGAEYVAPSPYTLKAALEKGDIFTKLSALVFGLGNIVHKQYVKGLLFLAGEVGFILFMIFSGAHNLSMLPSLGWRKESTEWVGAKLVHTPGDNSVTILLYGVCTLVICLLFLLWWSLAIRSAYKAQCLGGKNGRAPSFMDDIHTLFDSKANILLLALPVAGILIFTVLPLIFMISMAFTSYDHNHLVLFDWVGLQNFKAVFSNSGSIVSGRLPVPLGPHMDPGLGVLRDLPELLLRPVPGDDHPAQHNARQGLLACGLLDVHRRAAVRLAARHAPDAAAAGRGEPHPRAVRLDQRPDAVLHRRHLGPCHGHRDQPVGRHPVHDHAGHRHPAEHSGRAL